MYRDSLPSLDSVAKVFDVNHRGAKSIIYAMLERKLVAETSAPWSRQSVVYEVTGIGPEICGCWAIETYFAAKGRPSRPRFARARRAGKRSRRIDLLR
jgi:hypothetical protein